MTQNKTTLTPEEARDRINEIYEQCRPLTDAEFAEVVRLVNILQDAQEAVEEYDDDERNERAPLTALMSEDQREQMVRY